MLNDFVAIGYAIPALTEKDLLVVNDRPRDPTGPIAVLGPGTGLGQTQLMWDTGIGGYVAWASEGSHAGFAPRGPEQRALLEFAEEELEMPCEVEHVACGTGLKRIYRFMCHRAGAPVNDAWVRSSPPSISVPIDSQPVTTTWVAAACGVHHFP